MGLFEKNPTFQKSDKGSKFAIECDWNSKFSQNVQVLVFWKKPSGFQKKMIFFKIVKNSKFAEKRDWFSDISQHVTKKRFRKQDWLFGKVLEFWWKPPKAANLVMNATELVGFL